MNTIEISDSGCSMLYLCTFSFLAFIAIQGSDPTFEYYVSEDKYAIALSPYVMMVHATMTGNNIPNSSDDEWVTVNHDLYGTRSSNQTIINEENVDSLRIKWQIVNNFEIQEPPIIVGNIGYVQDYAGNVIAFNIENGRVLWNVRVGYGPTMGLSYDDGLIFSSTASNGTVVALNATDGRSKWESQTLGDTAVGYSIDSFPIVWNDYVLAGSGGSGLPPGPGMVKGNVTALN
ncbi:MAG: PQQ-binding-like beta-propeller repeat protein, partial [Nitrososphaeraceae archaeon]